jgi:hypothetical protein
MIAQRTSRVSNLCALRAFNVLATSFSPKVGSNGRSRRSMCESYKGSAVKLTVTPFTPPMLTSFQGPILSERLLGLHVPQCKCLRMSYIGGLIYILPMLRFLEDLVILTFVAAFTYKHNWLSSPSLDSNTYQHSIMGWRRGFSDGDGGEPVAQISSGNTQYISEKGGNNAPLTYQDASGAPVEHQSPLGYSVNPVTLTLLNITMMIGAGIYSTPSSILGGTGSVGVSFIYWTLGYLVRCDASKRGPDLCF